jgi:CheY-like chemotaxis protein
VLIAEDVRINQVVIQKMLQSFGLSTIEIVENGEEAVQKLKENWYDVILMDIQMPVMDGLEASRQINTHFKEKKPVIIATTANALLADQEKYREAGIDGYLSKPINKEALKEALQKYI